MWRKSYLCNIYRFPCIISFYFFKRLMSSFDFYIQLYSVLIVLFNKGTLNIECHKFLFLFNYIVFSD